MAFTPEQASAFKKLRGVKDPAAKPAFPPTEEESASPEEGEEESASPETDEDEGMDGVTPIPLDENAARAKYQAAASVIRAITSQFPIDQNTLASAHKAYAEAATGVMPFLSPEMQAGLAKLIEKYAGLMKTPDTELVDQAQAKQGAADAGGVVPPPKMVPPPIPGAAAPVAGTAKPNPFAKKPEEGAAAKPGGFPPKPGGFPPKPGGFPPKPGGFPPKKPGGGFPFKKKFGFGK